MTTYNVDRWADQIAILKKLKADLPTDTDSHIHLAIVNQERKLGEQMARQAIQAAVDRLEGRV